MTIHELEIIKADLHKEHKENSELLDNTQKKLEAEIKSAFEDLILEYDDSVVVQYVNVGARYGLYVHIEFGFKNNDNKIDFGSSFSISRSNYRDCELNHGSVGPFGKLDTYQIKRLRVLNKLFDDWTRVEEILDLKNFNDYIILDRVVKDIENNIDKVDAGILEQRTEEILSRISVGTELKYTEDCPSNRRQFTSLYTHEITKIANKYIYLVTPYGGEAKIEKDVFVEQVVKGYLTIK